MIKQLNCDSQLQHPEEMTQAYSLHEILGEVHNVPAEISARLSDMAEKKHYGRRHRLVQQGSRCNKVFFVSDGLLRGLYEDGDMTDTRWFAGKGDVLSSVTAYYTGQPALFSIEAITDVDIYEISFSDIKREIDCTPELKEWLVKLLLEQLYVLERRYVIIGTGDARSRYEALLNARPLEILNQIPLKYIAQYLKITQETLSRVRRAALRP